MPNLNIKIIGRIKSPYKTVKEIPGSSKFNNKIGEIHLYKKYAQGLIGLETFSHIEIVFYFHKQPEEYRLIENPRPKPEIEMGIFACRSPNRPSKIGLSVVELIKVKDNIVYFKGIDMLDGTPVLDIKGVPSSIKVTTPQWLQNLKKKKW